MRLHRAYSRPVTTFRDLHAGPDVLLLANCWDAGTARLTSRAGVRAIATSSAAVAWSHGYPDGDALPIALHLATIRSIARVIELPLSVDAEAGYATDPGAVADTIAAFVDAGAAGINLEDAGAPAELLAHKIAAIKQRVEVFVNARTDVYLRGLVPPAERVAEVIARGLRYRDAGADGLFVPGVIEPSEIAAIAAAVDLPLNVLARPKLPAVAALQALGVRRLSAGSALAQSAWARMAMLARDFLADGRSEPLAEHAVTHGEINAAFL